MDIAFLLILALFPGIVLLYIILFMDRNEKEPLGLVLTTMLLGALSLIPTAILEKALGALPIYGGNKISNAIMISFVQVAWVEELAKLNAVFIVAWRNKNFNEENDGIVYMGASALGFAMLENVFYVLSYGLSVGIMRAITAMPIHCFTGVLMGYYLGKAKFAPKSGERNKNILKGFFLAFFLHGLYDTLILTETPAALLILPMVVVVAVFGFKLMQKGRALSIAHAAEAPIPAEDIYAQQELLFRIDPKKQLWKLTVSRTLLIVSGLFWAILILGIAGNTQKFKSEVMEVILGGILFSFIPIVIGLILEISYQRKKILFKKLTASRQTMVLAFPPGGAFQNEKNN